MCSTGTKTSAMCLSFSILLKKRSLFILIPIRIRFITSSESKTDHLSSSVYKLFKTAAKKLKVNDKNFNFSWHKMTHK